MKTTTNYALLAALICCSLAALAPRVGAQGGVPLWTNAPGGTTVKFSSAGTPVWTNNSGGYAIAIDNSGDIYVTSSSFREGSDYETTKISSTGVAVWTNRYDGGGRDFAQAIAVNGSGNVFVTGYSESRGSAFTHDYLTIAYSPAGELLWLDSYSGITEDGDNYASAIATDNSGNVFVTGASTSAGGRDDFRDFATIKYSPGGVPLWIKRYNGSANRDDYAIGTAVDNSGNVVVTGYSQGSAIFVGGTDADFLTIKYSNEGMPLWTRRYGGPPGTTIDWAQGVVTDSIGNVIVTGTSFQNNSGGSNQYATVAYSGAGVPLWTNHHESTSSGIYLGAKPIALDNSGNVFVTGDPVTIKYSSSVPPPRLDFQRLNNELVLSWTNAGFNLQSAPAVTGPFTNLPTATSPYTNPMIAPRQFFRLIGS